MLVNWVICFERALKTFKVCLVGERAEYVAEGRYMYSHTMDLSFCMEGFGRNTALQLQADKAASWGRRLFGTAPLVGDLTLAGQRAGRCIVQDSHEAEKAVIRLESNNPVWVLEAHRREPRYVVSPLCICGIDGAEIVLEDYYMLAKYQRVGLPDHIEKTHYAGSCHNLSRGTLERFIEGIGVIVTVNALTVRDSYMSLGP